MLLSSIAFSTIEGHIYHFDLLSGIELYHDLTIDDRFKRINPIELGDLQVYASTIQGFEGRIRVHSS